MFHCCESISYEKHMSTYMVILVCGTVVVHAGMVQRHHEYVVLHTDISKGTVNV